MSTSLWVSNRGIEQFVALRGTGEVPVLVVHGGPGISLLPFASRIARMTELERHFTLAYWEQPGTGRSRKDLDESDLSLNGIVSDCAAVAEALRKRFGRPPMLFAHSWGSVVGVLAAVRYPDRFQSLVSAGQIVHVQEQERRSFQWARLQAEEAGDRWARKVLDRAGPPPHDLQEMLYQRAVLARYGGVWLGHGLRDLMLGMVWDPLWTPEYEWQTLWQQFADPFFSFRALRSEMSDINLFDDAPQLPVPARFIVGQQDWTTPMGPVTEYAERVEAPVSPELICFEASAHLPFLEEPAAFESVLRDASEHS